MYKSRMNYLRDPETGEQVLVGGAVFYDLERQGRIDIDMVGNMRILPATRGRMVRSPLRSSRALSPKSYAIQMQEMERPRMVSPPTRRYVPERYRALPAEMGPARPAPLTLTRERLEEMFPERAARMPTMLPPPRTIPSGLAVSPRQVGPVSPRRELLTLPGAPIRRFA